MILNTVVIQPDGIMRYVGCSKRIHKFVCPADIYRKSDSWFMRERSLTGVNAYTLYLSSDQEKPFGYSGATLAGFAIRNIQME